MHLAWHIAALMKAKRLPKLSTLLVKPRRKQGPQSWQDQLGIARLWAAALGGRIVNKNKGH